MKVAIVDCGSGNLRSVAKAVERAGSEAGLNVSVGVTTDPAAVRTADRIVLPGQGAFRDCRHGLSDVAGLEDALVEAVTKRAVPFLGICVGMQLMVDQGLEHGVTPGLSWLPGQCAPMTPSDPDLKIPHMGWNNLTVSANGHPVLDGIATGDHVYFVHSYAVTGTAPEHVLATADYGGTVTAIIGRDTMIGTQFHVEKSQAPGLRLIGNFLRWKP